MVSLESAKIFRRLPPDELNRLRAVAQERRFTAGAEIFREAGPADGIYIVQDGLVETSVRVGTDARRSLWQLGRGEILGEMALVEQQQHPATATALKDTRAWFIPRDEMLELLQRAPMFAFDTLQEVCRRLLEFDRHRHREIVEAERLAVLGQFARTIIHDLKTPLTIIGLSAEMAGSPRSTQEKRLQMQEQIRKQIARVNDMTGDILEFTGGAAPAVFKPAGYLEFVAELLPELQAEAAAKSVVIEFQTEPLAGDVLIDAQRLRRVFFNLLTNATGMMPGGGKIFLRIHAGDGEIVTEIEDTGRGIAPETLAQLFEPFAPRGKSRAGLGLPVCKKIIEAHRGRLWARNEPGRGAIFSFTLPIAK
jgi:signal transduction histidine kinase